MLLSTNICSWSLIYVFLNLCGWKLSIPCGFSWFNWNFTLNCSWHLYSCWWNITAKNMDTRKASLSKSNTSEHTRQLKCIPTCAWVKALSANCPLWKGKVSVQCCTELYSVFCCGVFLNSYSCRVLLEIFKIWLSLSNEQEVDGKSKGKSKAVKVGGIKGFNSEM